ncbi:outer membrane efflux protein [Labilithrix luteola]|uniref:Outer membrane efflux protein n=2 Tax=Labilithrix luteola TaxID=1391654 RepID=A0A0K1Q504_9BACT|nr:outer membrane efflux protein [Labilithrix luteola]
MADQVGQRAMATSYAAKASEQALAASGERTTAAAANWVPRIGLTARYTRLSNFQPPSIGGSTGSFVGTLEPGGTVNPSPTFALPANALSFPLVLDNWFTQAAITIPISDYFLRIGKNYSAATRSEDAARYDLAASRAKSFSDGKIAYFGWLRSRGAVVVAAQTLAVARAHLKDSENQFSVGNASKADVLRAQTQVASSELFLERAKSLEVQNERQVRVAMHSGEDEKLVPGDSLEGSVPPAPGNVNQLVAEGQSARPEIKSIDKSAEAARKQADAINAGRYPVLSGFGDVTYANPNSRRFPQQNEWFATWSLGAQVTWSPNDFLVAGPQATEAAARANQLEAQKGSTRDGIEIEVVQSYQSVVEADAAVVTTQRQLESAVEGYRVARELFNNGRGTGTTVIDAEQALAQTRLDHLNARVDARLARVRLDHALGRDVRPVNQ